MLQCLIDVGYKFPELNFKSAISPPKYQQSNTTRGGGKNFSSPPLHSRNPAKEDDDGTDTRSLTFWTSDIHDVTITDMPSVLARLGTKLSLQQQQRLTVGRLKLSIILLCLKRKIS